MEKKKKKKHCSAVPQVKPEVTNEKYSLIVSSKLEKVIRQYCLNCPDNEWSGVLFYKVEGTFETSLTVTCIDMFLMDVGNGVHTQFNESPEIASYMFENDLMPANGVYTGLIHSHNKMSAFFSGEDDSTITKEGTDRNHYVSLVVCNAGLYVARITRKLEVTVNSHIISNITTGYHTFGNEEILLDYKTEEKDSTPVTKSTVQQFDFKITVAEPDGNSDFYGARMCDLLLNPRSGGSNVTKSVSSFYGRTPVYSTPDYQDFSRASYNQFQREYPVPKAFEPSLFPELEVAKPAKVNPYEMFGDKPDFDPDKVDVDEDLVKEMTLQLVTGSIIPNSFVNLENISSTSQYAMFLTYFKNQADKTFKDFAVALISFLIESKLNDENLKKFYEPDEIEAIYAYRIIKTIKDSHLSNIFIWEYIKVLKVYLPKFMITKLDK